MPGLILPVGFSGIPSGLDVRIDGDHSAARGMLGAWLFRSAGRSPNLATTGPKADIMAMKNTSFLAAARMQDGPGIRFDASASATITPITTDANFQPTTGPVSFMIAMLPFVVGGGIATAGIATNLTGWNFGLTSSGALDIHYGKNTASTFATTSAYARYTGRGTLATLGLLGEFIVMIGTSDGPGATPGFALYINGMDVTSGGQSSGSSTTCVNGAGTYVIGQYSNTANRTILKGFMIAAAQWNRALRPAEAIDLTAQPGRLFVQSPRYWIVPALPPATRTATAALAPDVGTLAATATFHAPTVIDTQVTVDGDEGYWYTGNFTYFTDRIYEGAAGNACSFFARFPSISIAAGSSIKQAYISQYGNGEGTGNCATLTLCADDQASAAQLSSDTDASGRSTTTATVNWSPTLTSGQFNNSPDISAVIQELVDSYGGSLTVIQIFGKYSGVVTGNYEVAWQHFHGAGLGMKLHVVYMPPTGNTITSAALAPDVMTLAATATYTPNNRTATVALAPDVMTLAAAATYAPYNRTATAALAPDVATLAATATYAPYTRTATAALAPDALTLAASAQSYTVIFSATAALAPDVATLAGTATYAPSTRTATANLAPDVATLTATATYAPNTRTATAALAPDVLVLAANAQVTNVTYTITLAALAPATASVTSTATYAPNNRAATAVLAPDVATLAATATFTAAPTRTATAALVAGDATISATATYRQQVTITTANLLSAVATLAATATYTAAPPRTITSAALAPGAATIVIQASLNPGKEKRILAAGII